ncbi:unnamed protein product [Rotaria sordida]|uniref:Uncharacterized protein n=1 Tax=Rotaria sordida TaxID=392033 RepID=A0A815EIG7_9BILA|nr:unnamed protein product [Rotaria sordida]CAF1582639.1 unnamed protein product [Rotaria sordida]
MRANTWESSLVKQVTEIYENQLATNVNENNADKISNEDEMRPAKVSIGVGRDVTSAIRAKQQTITTIIGDECEYVGILIYKSVQSADVGFWLSEHLVRLVYPYPMLNFDILTSIDLDSILKKKSNALFCQNIEDENSSLTRY